MKAKLVADGAEALLVFFGGVIFILGYLDNNDTYQTLGVVLMVLGFIAVIAGAFSGSRGRPMGGRMGAR